MERVEKTVFISYRRKDIAWALNVYGYLTQQGYDVFFDYTSIHSGDFEKIIISNIKARAHFIVILTPTALDRCDEPRDWLRREIETAVDEKRNIVPIFFDGFDFGTPSIKKKLKGKLGQLKKYNGLEIPPNYFYEGMIRIDENFLNIPLDAVLHPVSADVQKIVEEQKAAAEKARQDEKDREKFEVEEKARLAALRKKQQKEIIEKLKRVLFETVRLKKISKDFLQWAKVYQRLFFLFALLLFVLGMGWSVYHHFPLYRPENVYFTSSRSGKNEIYYLGTSGETVQVTASPKNSTSWGAFPATDGTLYFTSNRSGKSEIYCLTASGETIQVTFSPKTSISWGAVSAFDGTLYFTSNRSGKNEIYYLDTSGEIVQVTASPDIFASWGAFPTTSGALYFTSNRSGQNEIYYLDASGEIVQVTDSPKKSFSWGAFLTIDGTLYFTSNRSGQNEIYYLNPDGDVAQVTFGSTGSISWIGREYLK